MRKVVFLGLAVLLLLGIGGAASAAPAMTGDDGDIVYGKFVAYQMDVPFAFEGVVYCRGNNLGFTYGEFPDLGLWLFSEAHCLRIEGNRAWGAAPFTKSNIPGYEGAWGAMLIVDNGDGDLDEVYSTHLPKAEALHVCQSMAPESEFPIVWEVVDGDIVVIDKHD